MDDHTRRQLEVVQGIEEITDNLLILNDTLECTDTINGSMSASANQNPSSIDQANEASGRFVKLTLTRSRANSVPHTLTT